MASIKTRIADLERPRNMALRRKLTNVELAVRLMRLEPGTPMYERAWAIIKRHTLAPHEAPTNVSENL